MLCSTAAAAEIEWKLRARTETSSGSQRFHTLVHPESWDTAKTAIIVCDVWDSHTCLNAVRRLEEFAPRLDRFLKEARAKGVTIIHSPSDCMESYKDHPSRQRALAVPKAKDLPQDISKSCLKIPSEEKGKYPIDQTDGGNDDDPAERLAWVEKLKGMGRNPKRPWTKESDLVNIDSSRDYITDKGDEVWSILQAKGINNVMLTGVHTNMRGRAAVWLAAIGEERQACSPGPRSHRYDVQPALALRQPPHGHRSHRCTLKSSSVRP